jgi:hypothetical protein
MVICYGDDDSYQITGNNGAFIAGRCGGNVNWSGMSFPQASAVHRIVCGPDATLDLR